MDSRTRYLRPSSTPHVGKLGLPTMKYQRPAAIARQRIRLHAVTEGSNESISKNTSKKSSKNSSKKIISRSSSSEKININRGPVVTTSMITQSKSRKTFRLGNPIKGMRNISRRMYRFFSKIS